MMKDEGTDQNMGSSDVGGFGKFIKKWLPLILAIVVGFSVVAIGDIVGKQNEKVAAQQASRNAQPDTKTSLSHCIVTEKQAIALKLVSFYVDTSCGSFPITESSFAEVKKDGVYDLVVTKFHGESRPYVTEVKESS